MILCKPYSVPDEIVEGALVYVLGQNPGGEEEAEGKVFVGRTGQTMIGEFFPEAGLIRGENVSIGNAICYRFDGPDGRRWNKIPSGKELKDALARCQAHRIVPPVVRLIVATGAAAWAACGQPPPITDWRGFIGPRLYQGRPVLGTLHVADLFGGRNSRMRYPCHRDWRKVKAFLAGTWPEPLPQIVGPEKMEEWFAAARRAPFMVCDTEYDAETKDLHLIGLGYPGSTVLQLHWDRLGWGERRWFGDLYRAFLRPIVYQNAMADIPVLVKAGVLPSLDYGELFEQYDIQDTMQAHSVLWSEWPHTLEFLASVYGSRPKMKHLKHSNPTLYNAGDVVDTISAWEGECDEFSKSPKEKAIYEEEPLKLLPIVLRAHERGIRVNHGRVDPARHEYERYMVLAEGLARAYTGRSQFNVGSDDQLKEVLYEGEGLPVQKHKATKKPSVDADSVAVLRGMFDPTPDYEREEREGLGWEEVERRVSRGAHPLLEARVFYAAAQQSYSHYILPCYVDRDPAKGMVERLYPEFHIHAQANARWSTVGPPMAQLPADLRDIVCPDEGTMWFEWDYDQFELRINAVMCGDKPSQEAFDNGWDIHTLNACDLFGLPYPPDKRDPHKGEANVGWRATVGWQGKDDPRRVFSKRWVYRSDYGGEAKRSGDIPGAKALGLTPARLVQASNRYLAAHPAKARWRAETRLGINRPIGGGVPYAETFLGRRRRISESGAAAWRIAFDYPMQAGVSQIANRTAIRIERELPWLDFMYQMHDGWKYQCPLERVEETRPRLRAIVEAEWEMYGQLVSFPATFKERYE